MRRQSLSAGGTGRRLPSRAAAARPRAVRVMGFVLAPTLHAPRLRWRAVTRPPLSPSCARPGMRPATMLVRPPGPGGVGGDSDEPPMPPMLEAAKAGDVGELRRLMAAGCSPDFCDDDGWSALMWAARAGRPAAARTLLDAGADAWAGNKFRSTALHHAAHWGSSELVMMLLDAMADGGADRGSAVDVRNQFAWTPLHWAGKAGMAGAAAVLLEAGADMGAKNVFGNTPLHEAVNSADLTTVRLLLDAIAAGGRALSVNERNGEDETAVVSAAYLGSEAVVSLLLERGCDPALADRNGFTPLHQAARGGHVEVVELLLRHRAGSAPGGNVVHAATVGEAVTPLHEAARWGRCDVMELLVGAGADPNARNARGETPLHCAALWGRDWSAPEGVELLLRAGADPTAATTTASEETPLDYAASRSDPDDLEDVEVYVLLQEATAAGVAGSA
jgi:ankyrin repeat protein